jgi:hypothetical protein
MYIVIFKNEIIGCACAITDLVAVLLHAANWHSQKYDTL